MKKIIRDSFKGRGILGIIIAFLPILPILVTEVILLFLRDPKDIDHSSLIPVYGVLSIPSLSMLLIFLFYLHIFQEHLFVITDKKITIIAPRFYFDISWPEIDQIVLKRVKHRTIRHVFNRKTIEPLLTFHAGEEIHSVILHSARFHKEKEDEITKELEKYAEERQKEFSKSEEIERFNLPQVIDEARKGAQKYKEYKRGFLKP